MNDHELKKEAERLGWTIEYLKIHWTLLNEKSKFEIKKPRGRQIINIIKYAPIFSF